MLRAASTDLLNPLVPKAHIIVSASLQIKLAKVKSKVIVKASLWILFFAPSALIV